jgi:hypothetical protein
MTWLTTLSCAMNRRRQTSLKDDDTSQHCQGFQLLRVFRTTAEHRRFTASRSIMMPTDEFLVRTGVFVILAFRVKWRWHTTPHDFGDDWGII